MLKYISFLLLISSCNGGIAPKREEHIYVYSYKQSNSDTTVVVMDGNVEKSYKCGLGEIGFTYATESLGDKKIFSCSVRNEKNEVIERDSMVFTLDKIAIGKYFFTDRKINKILHAQINFEEAGILSWYTLNKDKLTYNSFSTFLSLIDYGATNDISCTSFWNDDMLDLNSFLIFGLVKSSESDTVWEVGKNGSKFMVIIQNHLFKTNAKKELLEHTIVGNSKKSFILYDTVYRNSFVKQDSVYQKYACRDYLEGTSKEIFKSKSSFKKDSLRITELNNKDVTILTIERKKDKNYSEITYSNGIIIKIVE